ncbi:hypothetical protein H3Z85_18020 [Chryseobacterium indologenes]|uniref:hypothetical protein n=1 Tax=Chryseobacterium indologenes TaxID=253 RepID=UPI0003E07362|nr:hypothetical protein [Chryseobacterium indologenes]QPQ51206.1 hypothetical protein H3Z85_18020 [Chryseobacterium indologenes]GAE66758.1 hypothetical protein CIN01S_18_00850 [Chryseobacterium indologenes NBRC 14944]SFK00859.1 hypothetical protein SAMN05421692_3109 [Chryseobacterium indologenes]SUX49591.1 Uncharacterised protein [Chryseobacterium indologenes]
MTFEGAVIKEQGVTFAIVVVKEHVLDSSTECNSTRGGFQSIFPGLPVILMAQNNRGIPRYQGRKDIVNFLANVHPSRIPWKRYNYN